MIMRIYSFSPSYGPCGVISALCPPLNSCLAQHKAALSCQLSNSWKHQFLSLGSSISTGGKLWLWLLQSCSPSLFRNRHQKCMWSAFVHVRWWTVCVCTQAHVCWVLFQNLRTPRSQIITTFTDLGKIKVSALTDASPAFTARLYNQEECWESW